MAVFDPDEVINRELVRTINEVFEKAYPGQKAVDDPRLLIKRIKMLSDDLQCTRQNWKTSERAYVALDCKHRGIKQHWWQFWRHRNSPPRSRPE